MLHRYKSSQYLFHYIATEIVGEWIILRWLITIYIIALACIYRARLPLLHYTLALYWKTSHLLLYCETSAINPGQMVSK